MREGQSEGEWDGETERKAETILKVRNSIRALSRAMERPIHIGISLIRNPLLLGHAFKRTEMLTNIVNAREGRMDKQREIERGFSNESGAQTTDYASTRRRHCMTFDSFWWRRARALICESVWTLRLHCITHQSPPSPPRTQ